MAEPNTTTVVIPAFGEGPAVADVVMALRRAAPWKEILVIDDGSADDTGAQARGRGGRHPSSIQQGQRRVAEDRHPPRAGEWILVMDGDGQHHPGDAVRLVSFLGECDLVIGARSSATQATPLAGGATICSTAWPATSRSSVPDLTSGFRAARREHLLEFLHLLPNGFSSPTTTTLAFLRAGYNVRFEPIDARQRNGQSKIKLARDGAKFFLILLKVITIYSPLRIFVPLSLAAFARRRLRRLDCRPAVAHSQRRRPAAHVCGDRIPWGLVSEQISTLHFAPPRRDRS